MYLELDESGREVLRFLTSLRRGDGKTVEFKVDEVLSNLGVSREDFDRTLMNLREKGYIKIVKVPPSKLFIDELRRELLKLDSKFLLGELKKEDYLREREKLLETLTEIPKELGVLQHPLPPAPLPDVFRGFKYSLGYLEKLGKRKKELKPEVYENLRKSYNEVVSDSVSSLKRFASILSAFIEERRKELDELERELEALETDERIRGVNLTREKEGIAKRIKEVKGRLERVASLLSEKPHTKKVPPEEIKRLEAEAKSLKDRLEVLNARMLIEGATESLTKEKASLENKLKEIEGRLSKASEKERGEEWLIDDGILTELLNRVKSLKEEGLLEEGNYRLASDTLRAFKQVFTGLEIG